MLAVQMDLGTMFPPAEGSLQDAPLLKMDAIDRCSGHAVVFDLETTGLHWWVDKPIGMALFCPAQEIYGYIPFYTYQDGQQIQEIRRRMLQWSPETTVFGHNLKFDFHMAGLDPSTVPWSYYDTMWMAHIVDSRGASLPGGGWINPLEEKGSLKLGDLARFYLGDESKLRWLDKQRGKKHWEWKLQALSRYAAEDARLTLALAKVLWRELQHHGQLELLRKSMRWLAILWRTERAGILLDQDYLHQVKTFLQPQLEQLENELFSNPKINHRFDWRSHPVLSRVLYEEFGHPRPVNPFSEETRFKTQYTKTGTSSFLLAEKAHHPLANHIIQMRGIDKLLQFCQQWFGLVDTDSYLHTSFNGTGARTGRISSSDPNLQQLPSDTRSSILTNVYEDIEALEAFFAQTNMRKAFRSKPGHSVLAVDYRQQEIRLFAVLSNDPNLLATIRSGQDVHGGIAQQIWGHNTDPWRDWAKVVSFGRTIAEVKPSQLLETYGRRAYGNQQPGWLGTATNGSETDSATRPVAAATRLAA